MKEHILKELSEFQSEALSRHEFIKLRGFTLIRIIFFNGRRVNEQGRTTIAELKAAFESEWINNDSLQRISLSKDAIKDFHIPYITAKNSSTVVSVIIPKELRPQLDILISSSARKHANVHPDNMYVFPHTEFSKDPCSGWHDVEHVIKTCKVISSITATDIRHHRVHSLQKRMNLMQAEDYFANIWETLSGDK